jgi:hypothetical protein
MTTEPLEPARPIEPNLPANPLSIELTMTNRRLWWPDGDEGQPETWDVSADVWDLDLCIDEERHVADIGLAIVNLTRPVDQLDALSIGEGMQEFLNAAVDEPLTGRLHPDLEDTISPGPPRLAVLRTVHITEPWQGNGFAPVLVAGTLSALRPMARLAACRTHWEAFLPYAGDEISADLTAARARTALEPIGFYPWHDVHILDLTSPRLSEARKEYLDKLWPDRFPGDI